MPFPHQGIHSLLWTQDRGAALTLTIHHDAEEEDTESLEGEVSAQSHPDPTSSRSQSQLQDQPVRRRQGANRGLYRPSPTSSLLRANSDNFHHFRHYWRLHLPLSEAQTPMSFCIFNISLYEQHGLWPPASVVPESQVPWPRWNRKVASKNMSDSLSPDHPGWSSQTMRSGRVKVWDWLAYVVYLWWHQAPIFPGTQLWVEAENSKKAWNSRIIIRPAGKKSMGIHTWVWRGWHGNHQVGGMKLLVFPSFSRWPGDWVLDHIHLCSVMSNSFETPWTLAL